MPLHLKIRPYNGGNAKLTKSMFTMNHWCYLNRKKSGNVNLAESISCLLWLRVRKSIEIFCSIKFSDDIIVLNSGWYVSTRFVNALEQLHQFTWKLRCAHERIQICGVPNIKMRLICGSMSADKMSQWGSIIQTMPYFMYARISICGMHTVRYSVNYQHLSTNIKAALCIKILCYFFHSLHYQCAFVIWFSKLLTVCDFLIVFVWSIAKWWRLALFHRAHKICS